MVLDGLKAYVQLAAGLTDVTRERATAAARALVSQGEAGVDALVPDAMRTQVGTIAEDLLATGKANRDLLVGLVRAEVERSVARLGLVSAAELDAASRRAQSLDDRVDELERELRTARSRSSASGARRSTAKKTARKSSTKRTGAKKSAAKKSTAKKSPAKKTTARKSTAKKSTAKKSTARKSTARKSTARKSTARKSTARKSTARTSASS